MRYMKIDELLQELGKKERERLEVDVPLGTKELIEKTFGRRSISKTLREGLHYKLSKKK